MNERHLAALDFLVRAELRRSIKEMIKREEESGAFNLSGFYYGLSPHQMALMNLSEQSFEKALAFLGEAEFLEEATSAIQELGY